MLQVMALSAATLPPSATPDGRYIVVRGRLWRKVNPHLSEEERSHLVAGLMRARRQVRASLRAKDPQSLRLARQSVDEAKHGLGERGPVWWSDGAPDYNRHMVRNTPYGQWYAALIP